MNDPSTQHAWDTEDVCELKLGPPAQPAVDGNSTFRIADSPSGAVRMRDNIPFPSPLANGFAHASSQIATVGVATNPIAQQLIMRRQSDLALRRHMRRDSAQSLMDIVIPEDGRATPQSLIITMAASTQRLRALSLSTTTHGTHSMHATPLTPHSDPGDLNMLPSPELSTEPMISFAPTNSLNGMLDALGDALRNPLQALRSSFDLLRQTHGSAHSSGSEDPWVIADDCITRLSVVADLVAGNEDNARRPALARSKSAPPPLSLSPRAAQPPAGARILVTDDDPIVRKVLVRSLEKAGMICDVASDGAEAYLMVTGTPYPYSRRNSTASTSTMNSDISPATPPTSPPSFLRFQAEAKMVIGREKDISRPVDLSGPFVSTIPPSATAQDFPCPLAYDVIVMDVHMPNVDGITATQALRAAGVETPVVGLSGHSRPEYRESALAAGMDDFVQKPCRWAHLLDVLAHHIERRSSFRGHRSTGIVKTGMPAPRLPQTAIPSPHSITGPSSGLFANEAVTAGRARPRALTVGAVPLTRLVHRSPINDAFLTPFVSHSPH
ncbi:hypothetical protein BKA62DRAFT_343858 [Auriculariales sp. MPI-PUGE-AT-0066]|nr:hypothetical protein BKA62DRAFT_343858 [Auriculariales sp. MPI-PUGE-AT-0066]